jgi:hypothetical protein
MKYSKADEKIIKQLMEHLYDKHQKIRGSGMAGGSGFTEFLHGFTVPFKELGSVFNYIVPGLGTVIKSGAEAIDTLIPGARYDSMADVISGKKIQGTGMVKRGRGRPRKIAVLH